MTTPPGGPYGSRRYGNPYSAQQYPQAGQQFPPGGPPGPYPPNKGPTSRLAWVIIAGLITLSVIALVVTLMVMRGGNHNKPLNAQPAATSSAGVWPPRGSAQTATGCTPNVSGGREPTSGTIRAGGLSFLAATAPGWTPFSDDQDPNLIDAVGVAREVPGVNHWVMVAELGITNFVPNMDVSAQASKYLQCLAAGPAYATASPTLGPTKTSPITVDGVKAARADAEVTVGDPTLNTKGDSVTVIAVGSKPVTVFFATTPIGDADSATAVANIIAALKVTKS